MCVGMIFGESCSSQLNDSRESVIKHGLFHQLSIAAGPFHDLPLRVVTPAAPKLPLWSAALISLHKQGDWPAPSPLVQLGRLLWSNVVWSSQRISFLISSQRRNFIVPLSKERSEVVGRQQAQTYMIEVA